MTFRPILATVCAGVLLGAAFHPATASADAVEEFYKGNTVTVMVPSSLGATLGLYGRLLVDHLGKHIPGKPNVIIEARPGAGGTVGAAFAFNAAAKDGTYVAQVLAPSVLQPILRDMRFDASKFVWLGSQVPRPAVVSVWHTAPGRTVADARKTQLIMGSTGRGSETYLIPKFMNEALGTNFHIIAGYAGGAEVNLAMEQAEVHGRMQYWTGWTAGKPDWLRDKLIFHMTQYGPPIPGLDDVPRLRDLVTSDEHKAMVDFLSVANEVGLGYWVHPDVPAERIAALRAAFRAVHQDSAYLAEAKQKSMDIEYVPGEQLDDLVRKVYDTPKATIDRLKVMLEFE